MAKWSPTKIEEWKPEPPTCSKCNGPMIPTGDFHKTAAVTILRHECIACEHHENIGFSPKQARLYGKKFDGWLWVERYVPDDDQTAPAK